MVVVPCEEVRPVGSRWPLEAIARVEQLRPRRKLRLGYPRAHAMLGLHQAATVEVDVVCGILPPGALWEHERSVAVAAPTAVSSGLVHLVGLQSRHTAQKGR